MLLVVIFALPVQGLKEDGGTGIVLGPGAAFKVTAPTGWVFDNESCKRAGIPAVIYPLGKGVVLLHEGGTFSVKGNKLTLCGQGGLQREISADGREISSKALSEWDRTYTFKLLEVEGAIHGPSLVLWGVEENDLDGGYSGFIPNAFVYVLGYH